MASSWRKSTDAARRLADLLAQQGHTEELRTRAAIEVLPTEVGAGTHGGASGFSTSWPSREQPGRPRRPGCDGSA
jgi:hypothetical protein